MEDGIYWNCNPTYFTWLAFTRFKVTVLYSAYTSRVSCFSSVIKITQLFCKYGSEAVRFSNHERQCRSYDWQPSVQLRGPMRTPHRQRQIPLRLYKSLGIYFCPKGSWRLYFHRLNVAPTVDCQTTDTGCDRAACGRLESPCGGNWSSFCHWWHFALSCKSLEICTRLRGANFVDVSFILLQFCSRQLCVPIIGGSLSCSGRYFVSTIGKSRTHKRFKKTNIKKKRYLFGQKHCKFSG